MTTTAPKDFGVDIACETDADAFFSSTSGIDLVIQNAIHRITNDNVLGDDGTGSLVIVGWGFDVTRLLGLPAQKLAPYQPILSEVITRDPRIHTADVTLVATKDARGNADVQITVAGTSAAGPFSFVRSVSQLTTIQGATA